MTDRTHYEVLGVDPHAPKGDVKAAYQEALEAAQGASRDDEVALVRRAWQVLSDPVQRQRYDDEIGLHARAVERVERPDAEDREAEAAEVEVVKEGEPGPRRPRPSPLLETAPFLELPTLGRRLAASAIDGITLVAVFLASITVTLWITGATTGLPQVLTLLGWAEFWIVVLFIVPTARTGQTLGKRFTYLMTVDRATGNLCSPAQVVRRYIVPMIAINLLVPIGAYLALFFGLSYAMGRDQVSLADRLAKTAVVIARYRPTRPGHGA